MSPIEKFVGCVLAGAVVSVSIAPNAQASASLAINDETPLSVQTTPGFSYITSGASSVLSVTTDGYLFCANVYPDDPGNPPPTWPVTIAPGHNRWTLPTASDVQSIAYAGSLLRVNKPANGLSPESTLVCHARGAQGDVSDAFSAYGDWVFRASMEAELSMNVQYGNMINWRPPAGFDWAQPGAWSLVPTDPCNFDRSAADSPMAPEATLCTTATGVRPGGDFGTRAPTMWTQTNGGRFIYVARIDGRLGAQASAPNSNFAAPLQQTAGSSNAINTTVRDGFDSAYLSGSGTYCLLRSLPVDPLTPAVCDGALVSGPLNGALQEHFYLSLFPNAPTASFYVAVVRSYNPNNPPPASTPIAAIAVMADPGTVRNDQGDEFVGDDVVFGFLNLSDGFPWMGN